MEKNISISLCMIVKNEEETLERCLNSVKSFIDEIIIVDTGSTDNTKEIAKKFNCKIYDFKWINDFAAARNFSFSKASCDYIIWLDADDFIDENNIRSIKILLSNFNTNYDYVSSEYILGRNDNGKVSYSLRRNRIVKRYMNFKWIGNVHEYLEVYGEHLVGSFAIEHGKVKAYTDRNLKIFQYMEKNNSMFTPRDLLYYANELKDNGYYNKAIKYYRKFLNTKKGWIEDIKLAYSKIIECYSILGKKEKIPNIAFESFKIDTPKAEVCCALGTYYLDIEQYKQAIFWYKVAFDCGQEMGNPSVDNKEYYTWIPSIQLCICYFKIGNINCSYFFNELAATFMPNSDKIKYNRNYFEDEFKRRQMVYPKIELPIKVSDYIKYI